MLNQKNKILGKLTALILAQIFLLTGVIYPESTSNKNISSLYIHAKELRVPMMGAQSGDRLEEAKDTVALIILKSQQPTTDLEQLIDEMGYGKEKGKLIEMLSPYIEYGEDFLRSAITTLTTSGGRLSFMYSSLTDLEKDSIEYALPALIEKKKPEGEIVITIKSIGVGEGHELYETMQMVVNYLMKNGFSVLAEQGKIKIRLIGYDKTLSKLTATEGNVSQKLKDMLTIWKKCIETEYIYADLADDKTHEVLLKDKSDILFCRRTWVAFNAAWDVDKTKKFVEALKDNMNESGLIVIARIGVASYSYPDVNEVMHRREKTAAVLEKAPELFTGELEDQVVILKDKKYSFKKIVKTNSLSLEDRQKFAQALFKVASSISDNKLTLLSYASLISEGLNPVNIYAAVEDTNNGWNILALQIVDLQNVASENPALSAWIRTDKEISNQFNILGFIINDLIKSGIERIDSSQLPNVPRIRESLPSGVNDVSQMRKFLSENARNLVATLRDKESESPSAAEILKRLDSAASEDASQDRLVSNGGITEAHLRGIEKEYPIFGSQITKAINFLGDRKVDGTPFLDGISDIQIIEGSDTTSAEISGNKLVIRLNDTSFLDHATEQEISLYFLYILASARGTFGEAPQQQALQRDSLLISKEDPFERVILKDSGTGEAFMLVANFKRYGNRDKTRQNMGLFSDPSQEFIVNSTIIQDGNCTEARSRKYRMPFDRRLWLGVPPGCEIFRFIPQENPVFRIKDTQEILGVSPDLKEVLSFFIAAGVFEEEKNVNIHRITIINSKERKITANISKDLDAIELVIMAPQGPKLDLAEAIEAIARAFGRLDLSPITKNAEEKKYNIDAALRSAIDKAQQNINRTRELRLSAIKALWERKEDIYKNMVKDSPLDKYIREWVSKNAPNLKDFFIASWQMEMGFHPELSLSMLEAMKDAADKGEISIEDADKFMKMAAMAEMAGGLGALMVCLLRALADNGIDTLSLNFLYENYEDERTGVLIKIGDLMRKALEHMGAQIIDNIEVEYEGKKYNVKAHVCKLGYATQVWIDCLDAESLDRLYRNTNDSKERANQVKFYNEAGQAVIKRVKAEGIITKEKRIDFEQELYTNLDKVKEPAEYTFGTNHTVIAGGNPRFVKEFFEALLTDLLQKYGGNIIDNDNKLHLEVLGLFRALRVFGVSKDHADILLREVFPAALRKAGIDPESQKGKELLAKIVTGPDAPSNGTHAKHFQAPEIQELLYNSMAEYCEKFGKTYGDIAEDDSGFIQFLKEDEGAREFLMKSLDDVMPALQGHFLNLLNAQGINWKPDIRNPIGCIIRRIAEYKQLPRVVRDLFENPEKMKRFKESGRRLAIGGRFAPGLLDWIRQIIEREGIENQLAVVDDYNISDAAIIFQGISFWVMLSRKGEEAASTSGTKGESDTKPGIAVPDGVFHPKDGYLEEFDFDKLTGNGFFVKYTKDGEVDIDSLLDCFDNMGKVFANDKYRQHIQLNSLIKWLEKGNIVMHQARDILKVMDGAVREAENIKSAKSAELTSKEESPYSATAISIKSIDLKRGIDIGDTLSLKTTRQNL